MIIKTVADSVVHSDKEFLDAFIAETNLLEGKTHSEGNLGSCFQLETYHS